MTQPDDRTLDADPDTVERIREIARQAAAESAPDRMRDRGSDHTLDADETTLAQLRELAAQAPGETRAPRRLPDLSELQLPEGEEAVRPPPVAEVIEPWRPPARSMRPAGVTVQPTSGGAHPLWRVVAIALGVVVVVLGGWLLLDGGDGDAPPGDVPATPASGTRFSEGQVGEGGSGG